MGLVEGGRDEVDFCRDKGKVATRVGRTRSAGLEREIFNRDGNGASTTDIHKNPGRN